MIDDPQSAFELIFLLYDFLLEAKAGNDGLREPESRLLEAKYSVARKQYASFSERYREEIGEISYPSRGLSARGCGQDCFGNQSVQRELTGAGYTLTQPISEELTSLTPVSRNLHLVFCVTTLCLKHCLNPKLKPTMRRETSRSGVSIILKTIVDSNERQLLQHLSGINAPSNHTIPLLDVVDLSIGKTIIALPWKFPLDEFSHFRDRPDDVVSLCVAFLHQHKIAHCDLKLA